MDNTPKTLDDFKVGDVMVMIGRHKHQGQDVEDPRVAIVTDIDYNGLGGITYTGYHGKIHNIMWRGKDGGERVLPSGSGFFKPENIGQTPYGFQCAVKVIGSNPVYVRPNTWYPAPGNVGYDLMC